jgi:hypothetical protein
MCLHIAKNMFAALQILAAPKKTKNKQKKVLSKSNTNHLCCTLQIRPVARADGQYTEY